MVNKRRVIKTCILVLAVAGVGVVLMAWNPQPANAPEDLALTNSNSAPNATEKTSDETQESNTDVPEMIFLREGQSQLLFGARLNITLQRLESAPCTPPETNTPGNDPCANLPVTATLTVADKTDTNTNAPSSVLVFPSLGAVQTQDGYFYQFIDLSEDGNDQSARFLVRSLQPLAPPRPSQKTNEEQGQPSSEPATPTTTITIPAQ